MTPERCLEPPKGAARMAANAYCAALPVIETARLRLRAPRLEDYPVYEAIMLADTGHMGGPFSREEVWADFTGYVACWLLHGFGVWSVERRDDGIVIGFVHLGLEWEDMEPELGWMFAAAHRGNGYATEAARAARDNALAMMGEGKIISYIDPDNAASLRLAARLGAVRDANSEAALPEPCQVWRHGGTA